MRPIDADSIMPLFMEKANTMKDRHGVKLGEDWLLNYNDIKDVIDNAPTIKPKVVVIEPDIIEKLADSVVDVISKIDWDKAIEAYKERPQGEWIPVSERLPEDMQEVLVWFEYYRYGDYNCMYQTYGLCHVLDGKWSPFINGETGWQDARVIAWCPMPKPYKEAENE